MEDVLSMSRWPNLSMGRARLWLIGALVSVSAVAQAQPASLQLDRCMSGGTSMAITYTVLVNQKKLSNAQLKEKQYRVSIVVDDKRTEGTLKGDGFLLPLNIPNRRGAVKVRVDSAQLGGPWSRGPTTKVEVLPVVHLQPPRTLDFSEVPAGCGAAEHCRAVDLSEMGLWDGAPVVVKRPMTDANTNEAVEIRVDDGGGVKELKPNQEQKLSWSKAKGITVCLRPRTCSSLPDKPLSISLRVDHPCMGDLRKSSCKSNRGCPSGLYGNATVELNAKMIPSDWWDCNRTWVLSTLAGLILLILLYGYFIWPNRFHRHASIRIADNQRSLRRATPKALRICPGGQPGLFRHATVSLSAEGLTVKGGRGAIIRFVAGSNSTIAARCSGQLERLQRNKWKPVESGSSEASSLSLSTAYRVNGNIYFDLSM